MLESESALFKWLTKATHHEQELKIQELQNPKLFYELIKGIPQIPQIQFSKQNENSKPWQTNYTNIKNIYYAIQTYYRSILKSSFPIGLPSINLLQIAKGNDKQGIFGLLIIFFIACINSSTKQKYITYIMSLNQGQQLQIMNLINLKNLISLANNNDDGNSNKERIQQNKIDQLFFKIQSLSSENQSLNLQLMAQTQQKTKNKQLIKKLQIQNKKLKKQVQQNAIYLQQKQQQQLQQQSSRRVITDSNEQVILQLKKQIVEQQKKYLQQKGQLKQQIQQLQDKYLIAQDKISELQNSDIGGNNIITSNKKIQHQDCMSINQHKNIMRKLQMKIKQLQQKQIMGQRQLAKAKFQNQQINRKFKKQQIEKQNFKVQFEKISNKQCQIISQKDADQIKLSILAALRDKLKEKLPVCVKQNQQQQQQQPN